MKEKTIEELKKQAEEYLNGWKRERADFLNYKQEEMERIAGLMKYASEEMTLRILPVMDNCLTAEKNIPKELKEDEHVKGLLQIHQQMRALLKSRGIEEIEVLGKTFDPNFHEVVKEVEGPDSQVIVEEVQRGYLMHGKVIRPAKVIITK